jgi:hypothetical protein
MVRPADGIQLRGCALSKGLDRFFLGLVNLEDGEQLGNLKQIAYALCEVAEFYRSARVVRSRVKSYQRTQSAGIDIADATQIENDFLILRDQSFHAIAELGRFFSENDAAIAIQDQDILDGTSREFQLHGERSLRNAEQLSATSLPLRRRTRKG